MQNNYLSPAIQSRNLVSSTVPLVGVEARIYNDIWNAVIDRKLKPGTKLDEAVLCELYGISRTVIRKVMVILEQEGVVTLPLNRGAYIAQPSPRDSEELVDVVELLLCHFVTMLSGRTDDVRAENDSRLGLHLEAEKVASDEQNFHVRRRLRLEFGTVLGLLVGNNTLLAEYEQNSTRLSLALATYQDVPMMQEGIEYSQRVTEYILAGQASEAVELIRLSFGALRRTMNYVASGESDLRTILGRTT